MKDNFEENRRLQANVYLSNSHFQFKSGKIDEFEYYLYDIIGFFIIEATVINTTQNFRPRGKVKA